MTSADIQQEVLTFWFGEPSSPDYGAYRTFWFQSTPDLDAEISQKFGSIYDRAIQGELDSLSETAEGALSLILILDQFPRNMFRGKPQAFSSDGKALAIAKEAISKGLDQKLRPFQLLFFYLPFQHSESLQDQEKSLELYAALGQQESMRYAQGHYDLIKRFGRFPHRNAILGRENTPEERSYLAHPDTQSFGQK